MKHNIFVLLAIISLMVACQNNKSNKVASSGFLESGLRDSLMVFKPNGFAILDTSFGDLNGDQVEDVVVVYKRVNEEQLWQDSSQESLRPLLIYLGQLDGTMRFSERCDNAVMCHVCGGAFGDPFLEVAIKEGQFTVHHLGGSSDRWTRSTTFAYDKFESTWMLSKDENGYFNMFNPEEADNEVKTVRDFGKVKLIDFKLN